MHRGKRLVFILAAVVLGLLPLVLTETVLRCCHIGLLSDAEDPYVGFEDVRPLFQLNSATQRYEIGPERQTFFRPDSFPQEKRANVTRIFCLGGSTVQGRPFAIETSFTTWLKLTLQTADPSQEWEVVNCGGVSYASYRLVPILREVLEYEPDLIILCTGHNEFLEDRTYHAIKTAPPWLTQSHARLSRLHTYNALRSAALYFRGESAKTAMAQRPQLPEEVDALLDYWGGLDDYHRDSEWQQGTIAHFEFNLNHMIAMARQRHTPVLLINPPYNLKDVPPFKYENRSDITADEQQRFSQLWSKAKQEGITVSERIDLLRRVLALDDQHAGVQFHLGRCLLNDGQPELAKEHLVAAKDLDICPLRILSPMRQAVARAATTQSVPLVDAQQLFEQVSPNGITNDQWFVDHVHPTMHGHRYLAAAIFESLVQSDWLQPTSGWESRRDTAFRDQIEALEPMYFIRGQQRLEGLRAWTKGRASLMRPDDEDAPPGSAPNAAEAEDPSP